MKTIAAQRRNGLVRKEDGQDVIEYALLIALVALGAIGCLKQLSGIQSWIANIGAWFISYLT